MSVFDVEPDLALEADARESDQYLRDWAEQRASADTAPGWRRLLQRKR